MRALTPVLLLSSALVGCSTTRHFWAVETALPETRRVTALGEVTGGAGRYGSHAWLGLPFAAPPVGELRWRAPRPPQPWSAPRQALEFSEVCPQPATPLASPSAKDGELIGSEDCLTLNVFAPPFASSAVPTGDARLPVMVFIHGGGNSIGTAAFYDGGRLAVTQKVIVVSTQYRLGPLGWFRHASLRAGVDDPWEQSGNFGTLDLIRALEWVRDNISAFGGNPDNVTIFGESAGATNVLSLLVSPKARGLFHRAIAQSGVPSRTTVDDAEAFLDDGVPGHQNSSNEVLARLLIADGQAADREAAKMRLAALGNAGVAAYLRGKSLGDLFAVYAGEKRALNMLDMPLVINDGLVLPEDDWLGHFAQPTGWNRVPVLLGTNRDEMRLFYFLDPRRTRRILGLLPRMRDEGSYTAGARLMSRAWKAWGADEPASAMVRSGATDVWVYRWDWDEEPRVWGSDLATMMGAAHGLELPFVFGHFDMGELNALFTEENRAGREALSGAMMASWAHFARTGNPAAPGQPAWPSWAAASDAPQFRVFDTEAHGGLRLATEVERLPKVLADIEGEQQLPTKERCRLMRDLVTMLRVHPRGEYEKVKTCAAYPLQQYPWDDRD